MEYITLNNGTKAPAAGIGTFLMSPADAEEAVFNALTNGYRLVDTANAYMNERAVGRGMKRSGVAREDIYLCTGQKIILHLFDCLCNVFGIGEAGDGGAVTYNGFQRECFDISATAEVATVLFGKLFDGVPRVAQNIKSGVECIQNAYTDVNVGVIHYNGA